MSFRERSRRKAVQNITSNYKTKAVVLPIVKIKWIYAALRLYCTVLYCTDRTLDVDLGAERTRFFIVTESLMARRAAPRSVFPLFTPHALHRARCAPRSKQDLNAPA